MPWDITVLNERVCSVVINSHPVNIINHAFLDDMEEALDKIEALDGIGVVFTGTGSTFSAGLDLRSVFKTPEISQVFVRRFEVNMLRLQRLPRVTVAALNGHTIAGGCCFALACDVRIMVDNPSFKIGVDEVMNGVGLPRITKDLLTYATSLPTARRLLMFGELVSPKQALELNLVQQLVGKSELMTAACRAASRIPLECRSAFINHKRYILGLEPPHNDVTAYTDFSAATFTDETLHRLRLAQDFLALRSKKEIVLEEDGELRYEVLLPHHAEETVMCVNDVWLQDAHIFTTLGVTFEEFCPIVVQRVALAARVGCSVVITRQKDASRSMEKNPREVIGFFLVEDFAEPLPVKTLFPKLSPAMDAQLSFMDLLDGMYIEKRGMCSPGQVAHGVYGGVRKAYRGRAVGMKLTSWMTEQVKRKGYERFVSEAVAVGSQTISHALKHTPVVQLPFSDFMYKGKPVLQSITSPGQAIVFEKHWPLAERLEQSRLIRQQQSKL